MSAVYTPLFDKIQRHILTAIRHMSAGIRRAIRQGRRAQLCTYNACLRTHFRDTYIPNKFAVELWQLSLSLHYMFVLLLTYIPCCLRFSFACLLVCLPPKKKRPHAPGTHATRRNIAVAIPLAFNKRLQQHMRSTTLDEDGPQRLFEHKLGIATTIAINISGVTRRLNRYSTHVAAVLACSRPLYSTSTRGITRRANRYTRRTAQRYLRTADRYSISIGIVILLEERVLRHAWQRFKSFFYALVLWHQLTKALLNSLGHLVFFSSFFDAYFI